MRYTRHFMNRFFADGDLMYSVFDNDEGCFVETGLRWGEAHDLINQLNNRPMFG